MIKIQNTETEEFKYPGGVKFNRVKRRGKRINKYHAHKTKYDGITFDSKAEFRCYLYLKANHYEFKYHERFQILPRFVIPTTNKISRYRVYTPDFTVYQNSKLIYAIDVKGGRVTMTDAASLRIHMFMYQYSIPVQIWQLKHNQWVKTIK